MAQNDAVLEGLLSVFHVERSGEAGNVANVQVWMDACDVDLYTWCEEAILRVYHLSICSFCVWGGLLTENKESTLMAKTNGPHI